MYVIMDLCIYGLSELNIAERLILLFHVVGLHCSMLPILICGFPLFFFMILVGPPRISNI